jgi:hypothetical protein
MKKQISRKLKLNRTIIRPLDAEQVVGGMMAYSRVFDGCPATNWPPCNSDVSCPWTCTIA